MKHIISADSTSLYVKIWGTGRPVILIHGWPLSADSWDAQAMALGRLLAIKRLRMTVADLVDPRSRGKGTTTIR